METPRIPRFLGALLHRRDTLAADREAERRHRWSRASPGLPPGLELQWLGTAGFRLSYRDFHLLIDPYLTRPGLRDLLSGCGLLPSLARIQRYLPGPVNAVLLGHTHFDHALDAPEIARLHDATVYGSRSLTNLMKACGLTRQSVEVEPHRAYEVGPFAVTFVPSLHSRLLAGLAVPFDGDIQSHASFPLTASGYRCGQVFGIHIAVAGTSFYHQGSANLIESEIEHRGVDYFLAAISGRGFTRDYVARILGALEPRTVVPHHYDDFLRPLDQTPGFSFNVGLAQFVDDVRRTSPSIEIRTLAVLESTGG